MRHRRPKRHGRLSIGIGLSIDQSQQVPAFDPLSFSPALWVRADGTLWQDSGRTSLVTADGQTINAADDLSGFGRNLFNISNAGPTYKVNIFGSLPAMVFDGIGNYLQAQAFSPALVQPNTIFFAGKLLSFAGSPNLFDGANHVHGLKAQSAHWNIQAGANLATSTADDFNAHVFCLIFNGASSKIYVDGGAAVASGNAGTNTMDGITVGSDLAISHIPANMYFLEIIAVHSLLSLTQINAAGQYMATRLGTTWATAV